MAEIGLFETMYTARALRRYKTDPIPDDVMTKILEAGTRAPSGSNQQNWIFMVVKDAAKKKKISDIYARGAKILSTVYANRPRPPHMDEKQFQTLMNSAMYLFDHMSEAPVLLFAGLRTDTGGPVPNMPPEVAAQMGKMARIGGSSIYPAVQNIILACRAFGIGTVLTTLHIFYEDEVKEILGAGGMGVVYRAFDRELGEPVAIKTLRPDTVADDPVAIERFKQEIRLARRIAHRNVVRTYDLGEVNGMYYLTMEYVEGTSLKQLIQSRGRLPVPVSLTVGKQLCRALEVAHEQGVIHRDIKPQNIVVEPNGFLKVMDFGIARLANPPKGKGLTEQGMAIGTPDYMSPEQLSGLELDPRSDLYSAGVVLFESITGRVPFEADTPWALIAKHLEEEAPDPRKTNPDVPEALAKAVLKAMAKDRENRYRNATEMYDTLAAIG